MWHGSRRAQEAWGITAPRTHLQRIRAERGRLEGDGAVPPRRRGEREQALPGADVEQDLPPRMRGAARADGHACRTRTGHGQLHAQHVRHFRYAQVSKRCGLCEHTLQAVQSCSPLGRLPSCTCALQRGPCMITGSGHAAPGCRWSCRPGSPPRRLTRRAAGRGPEPAATCPML